MSRFQAQTSAVLDRELEDLRERLGLRADQKADLLREVAALASWVVRQSTAGRTIEARGESGAEVLVHPVLERLQARTARSGLARVILAADELDRLACILAGGFKPTSALRKSLRRLAGGERRDPPLRWRKPGKWSLLAARADAAELSR